MNEFRHQAASMIDDDFVVVAQLQQMLDQRRTFALDVRSADEYAVAHVPGSHSLPLQEFATLGLRVRGAFVRPLVLICDSGALAVVAHDELMKQSIESFVLRGGLNAWKSMGLPVKVSGKSPNP